jgi:hypothetical protein
MRYYTNITRKQLESLPKFHNAVRYTDLHAVFIDRQVGRTWNLYAIHMSNNNNNNNNKRYLLTDIFCMSVSVCALTYTDSSIFV